MPTLCQSIAERVFFGIVIVWLVASALTVDIEYYDGYSAIANARYFLGFTKRYVFDRGPLMGFLLMPAEAFRAMAGLHSLDLRPHHLTMTVVHAAYQIAVYALLVRVFGRSWSVLASFVACVPSFLFFSYGPFLSHDLFPGLLLFAMLFWRERFVQRPSVLLWIELVILGTAAALVKQTFGVFWILLLVVSGFHTLKSKNAESGKTFLALAYGAVASGIFTWLVLGAILGNTDPNTSLLIRPYRNLQYLAGVYEGKNVEFPLWIYVRNFPAYGWLMCLLILPGWVLSIRGTRCQQSLAIAWLGGLVFLHLLPLREVRYMAFLAPLSAGLLVPVLERLAGRRWLLAVAGFVLVIDLGRGFVEATKIFDSFYHSGIQARFFQELNNPATRKAPVFVNSFMVSFVAPEPSPLAADRYHRIFHFGVVHLQWILNCRDIRVIADAQSAGRPPSRNRRAIFCSSRMTFSPEAPPGGRVHPKVTRISSNARRCSSHRRSISSGRTMRGLPNRMRF